MATNYYKPQEPLKQIDAKTGDINYIYPMTTPDQVVMEDGTRLNVYLENIENPKGGGVSPTVTVSKNGKVTTIEITDVNGTKTATINDGADGKTPVKNTDYFDGKDGQRGFSILKVTKAPSAYTTETGGFTPAYRIALSTVKTQSNATEVLVGDTLAYSYYQYPIGYVDSSYVYLGTRVSIRGTAGTTPVKGTDYWTAEDKAEMVAEMGEMQTMFISPNGSDSNDGLTASTPKKTVMACVNAGATRISAKRGVYNEIVALFNIGKLEIFPTDNDLTYEVGGERSPIIFETVDYITPSNLSTYNSIKRVAYSNSTNTQFDKVFTKKSQTPVVGDGYGSRYNSTIWLLSAYEKTVCNKLKPVLTVAECEAETNTFTYVDGYIYINASLTNVEKIVVPTNWDSGIHIEGAEKVILKEVEVRFAGTYNINIKNCAYFEFYKCACKYTSYGSGFHPLNSNGVMRACYATKNYDGYGISGYGHTTYIDCVSEFNFDDGMSHHNGTTGTVIGGRYEGNGKGGNSPAYGAKVNIYGGLYKNNSLYGIGYLWSSNLEPASGMVQGAVMVDNPTGLSVNANCDVIAMSCVYKGNTTDKDFKGNVTEYDYNFVKTVNSVAPDENGNVVVEGGGSTGPKNWLPLAIKSDGTEYVGDNGEDGYRVGYRVSSSGVEKALDTACCTGFIPVKAGDVVRIKNFERETTGLGTVYFFTSAFAVGSGTLYTSTGTGNEFIMPDENGVLTFTVPNNDCIYFRFTAKVIDNTTIITINEEIV